MGFEPTYSGATIRCITKSATATVADTGVEPAISKVMSLEWFSVPLIRKSGRQDSNLRLLHPKCSGLAKLTYAPLNKTVLSTFKIHNFALYKIVLLFICLFISYINILS